MRKLKLENIFSYAFAFIVLVGIIFVFVSIIVAAHSGNLIEGTVVDKDVYAPTGRAMYPTFVLKVENNGQTDIWIVSESYYDSVHVGSYVKK